MLKLKSYIHQAMYIDLMSPLVKPMSLIYSVQRITHHPVITLLKILYIYIYDPKYSTFENNIGI